MIIEFLDIMGQLPSFTSQRVNYELNNSVLTVLARSVLSYSLLFGFHPIAV